jgi:hypothetical protein
MTDWTGISTNDLPSSWQEAKAKGIKWYFTGEPCEKGHHVVPRYACNGQCVLCMRDKLTRRRNTPDKLATRERKQRADREAQHAKALAAIERRGWRYVSGNYEDQHSRYTVVCAEKHEFPVPYNYLVYKNNGCNKCSYEFLYLPFTEFKKRVSEHGCEIVEVIGEWQGSKTEIRLRDPNGHPWPTNVVNTYYQNGWSCPNCRSRIGERIARAIFEASFGKPFPKVRPDWLRSKRGVKMELDGYNEELRLAFEYNGPHHQSSEQMARDDIKRRVCAKRGIRLIAIVSVSPFPPENVRLAVEKALREAGI